MFNFKLRSVYLYQKYLLFEKIIICDKFLKVAASKSEIK